MRSHCEGQMLRTSRRCAAAQGSRSRPRPTASARRREQLARLPAAQPALLPVPLGGVVDGPQRLNLLQGLALQAAEGSGGAVVLCRGRQEVGLFRSREGRERRRCPLAAAAEGQRRQLRSSLCRPPSFHPRSARLGFRDDGGDGGHRHHADRGKHKVDGCRRGRGRRGAERERRGAPVEGRPRGGRRKGSGAPLARATTRRRCGGRAARREGRKHTASRGGTGRGHRPPPGAHHIRPHQATHPRGPAPPARWAAAATRRSWRRSW